MLLFNVAKSAFNFGMDLYNRFSDKLHFSDEGNEMMQFLSSAWKKDEQGTSQNS